ncbi:MAG: hypothetical protein ACI855_004000 [Myxococcota bacterium]|jgi:hypothetical protein
MTSTRSVAMVVIVAVVSGCGAMPGTTHNSCEGLATSVFCSLPPPEDDLQEEVVEDSEVPVAVCEVDDSEQSLPNTRFEFDGAASYDPFDLEIVGYEWTLLERPAGSVAELADFTSQTTVLEGDAVGSYDVQLNVVDDLGLRSEEPCVIRVHVVDE